MNKIIACSAAFVSQAAIGVRRRHTRLRRRRTRPRSAWSGVEEVIVTGTRAPKAVDKIPGAINVVSRGGSRAHAER